MDDLQLDVLIVATSVVIIAAESVNLKAVKVLRVLRAVKPLRTLTHSAGMFSYHSYVDHQTLICGLPCSARLLCPLIAATHSCAIFQAVLCVLYTAVRT